MKSGKVCERHGVWCPEGRCDDCAALQDEAVAKAMVKPPAPDWSHRLTDQEIASLSPGAAVGLGFVTGYDPIRQSVTFDVSLRNAMAAQPTAQQQNAWANGQWGGAWWGGLQQQAQERPKSAAITQVTFLADTLIDGVLYKAGTVMQNPPANVVAYLRRWERL